MKASTTRISFDGYAQVENFALSNSKGWTNTHAFPIRGGFRKANKGRADCEKVQKVYPSVVDIIQLSSDENIQTTVCNVGEILQRRKFFNLRFFPNRRFFLASSSEGILHLIMRLGKFLMFFVWRYNGFSLCRVNGFRAESFRIGLTSLAQLDCKPLTSSLQLIASNGKFLNFLSSVLRIVYRTSMLKSGRMFLFLNIRLRCRSLCK